MGGGSAALALAARTGRRELAVLGPVAILAGAELRRRPDSFILRSREAVLRQVTRTLDLMSVGYDETPRGVVVRATGTAVHVTGVGPVSLLSFTLRDGGSPRERYLARTLVRFQRHAR
jgi:hypothetical protein